MSERNSITVRMDLTCNMHYSAFYVYALKQLYGDSATFEFGYFADLEKSTRCFRFVIAEGDKELKCAVDFHDSREVEISVLKWSNVYGKINLHIDLSKFYSGENVISHEDWAKVKSMPPSFGIRAFSLAYTLLQILSLIKSQGLRNISSLKLNVLNLVRMYIKRLPIEDYGYSESERGYVFLMATIWHESTAFINISRYNFIRACKEESSIRFEGGLVDVGYSCDYISDIDAYKVPQGKISLNTYLKKLRRSNFVFNGPSVLHCHGWKLGEYLCMGKAILSTPLSNLLPHPLVHGENIHFVEDNFESIKEGVRYLNENPDYVLHLEKGALQYWKTYGAPNVAITNLINHS